MTIKRWREVDGDNTYALNWDLNEDSHVWEIGGFEGRWAQQIWDKFHCYITIFEPQLWAVEKLKIRFEGIEKIDIRPYGLWLTDEMYQMGNYHTDGASLIRNDEREPTVPSLFKNFYNEIIMFPHEIDLALMNVEGAEYRLVHGLIEKGIMYKFQNFWCQWHPFDESDYTHANIFKRLELTHNKIWDFFPTAVAWSRK